jgi:transaldolase
VKRRSPPTPAGVPAIEAMLYEGVNVNITLLFAIKDHEAVAQAYIRALERRLAESQPVRHVASVASFFLSRIDVLVDQLLAHRIRPDAPYGEGPRAEHLFGKAAVANARLAYQSFKRTFSGERWRALAERGARVQRPLCAVSGSRGIRRVRQPALRAPPVRARPMALDGRRATGRGHTPATGLV